ncbi:MAG: hypothetical protein VYA84_15340 [Planctomycetota bacterium]|nr:hypothetical protein [Planctomycetota bacterium]
MNQTEQPWVDDVPADQRSLRLLGDFTAALVRFFVAGGSRSDRINEVHPESAAMSAGVANGGG